MMDSSGSADGLGVFLIYYRGFGGGFGLGTPVVSYAPRPILIKMISLVIIKAIEGLGVRISCCLLRRKRKEQQLGGGFDDVI